MFFIPMLRKSLPFWAIVWIACGGPGPETGPPPTPFWVDTYTDDAASTDTSPSADVSDAVGTDAISTDAVGPDTVVAADVEPVDTVPLEEKAYYISVRVNRELQQDPSPFGSDWSESLTASIGLIQIVWKGNVGTRWEQVCTMWSNRVHGSQILYSAPFVSAIPVEPVEIVRQDGVYSEALDQVWLGLDPGYMGDMPALGEDDHPALVDTDGDQEPGVSLDIDMIVFGNQKIFVAQRSTTDWSAPVGVDGAISAEPNVTHERATVGASVGVLVSETRAKPVPGKPADTMVWHPIEAPISCEALLADTETLSFVNWPPSVD